jgi:mannose/fructose/N-acetylgalactosamine-specific phosphotransferase system component IIC
VTQNIPLAIALVVIGSFCFALSAHFQHNAVDSHLEGNAARSG